MGSNAKKITGTGAANLCAWTLIGLSAWAGWQRFYVHRTVHPIVPSLFYL